MDGWMSVRPLLCYSKTPRLPSILYAIPLVCSVVPLTIMPPPPPDSSESSSRINNWFFFFSFLPYLHFFTPPIPFASFILSNPELHMFHTHIHTIYTYKLQFPVYSPIVLPSYHTFFFFLRFESGHYIPLHFWYWYYLLYSIAFFFFSFFILYSLRTSRFRVARYSFFFRTCRFVLCSSLLAFLSLIFRHQLSMTMLHPG